MSLRRRREFVGHPDVELVLAVQLEPDAAPRAQRLGLLDLGEAEQLTEEPSRLGFAAGWRGQLEMIDSERQRRSS